MKIIAREDLTGEQFGRLTVIRRDIERDKKLRADSKTRNTVHWLCQCSCGNPKLSSVDTYSLTSGHTQSCGCCRSEQIAKRNQKYSTKQNKIIDCGDAIILLDEKGNNCRIDKEDYPIVKQWYWRKTLKCGNIDKGYWVINSKIDDGYDISTMRIHQVIAQIKYGDYDHNKMMPDHLSRDTDDNRKCNICLKSSQDNSHNRGLSKRNSSDKTGVSYNRLKQSWVAYIMVDSKQIFLGAYKYREEAIRARKSAERKYGFTCDEDVASYDVEVAL